VRIGCRRAAPCGTHATAEIMAPAAGARRPRRAYLVTPLPVVGPATLSDHRGRQRLACASACAWAAAGD
jgi:hypothetical protein